MAATTTTRTAINAGARYYGALTLPLYDWAVLHTVVPYAWKCPLTNEQELYNTNVGAKHLDIGVASGYFLQHTQWPKRADVEITLMDLNPNSTKYAAHRLRQMNRFARVNEVVGDALEPFPGVIDNDDRNGNHDNDAQKTTEDATSYKFDSIAMFHLLHCIPGSLPEKSAALEHAAQILEPEEGVIFGANVTPADCTDINLFAHAILSFSHHMGALNNQKDSHVDMQAILHNHFHDYHVERVGCMTLWQARQPKL